MSAAAGARARLEALGASHPEFHPYLTAVGITLSEMAEPTWSAAPPDLAAPADEGALRLAGARIAVPERALRRHCARLFGAAGAGAVEGARADRLDVLALIEAAIGHDAERIEALAGGVGIGAAALGPLAQLAAGPLLQACRRALAGAPPPAWRHGFCPVCGGWATMAETRGLERARWLRCGRCGAGWGAAALACPFCGERDHERLVALLPEQGGEARKVEACTSCGGYLKTLTTLAAWPGEAVLLEDLATVDLDLAAVARGHGRPEDPGRAPGVSIVAAPEPRWSLRRWIP